MSSDDEDLVDHMISTQIEPQLTAARLRDAGQDVDVGFVYTGTDDRDGYETVACEKCGRTAQMPAATLAKARAKPGLVIICPACARQ